MTEEEIQQRVARGLAFHAKKYDCAQSVACATCDLAGMDEDATFRLMECFGKGLGDMSQVCGAVSGGCAIVGAALSAGPELCNSKSRVFVEVSQLRMAFAEQFGSSTCADLRPKDEGKTMEVCDGYIAAMIEAVCRKLG